MIPMFVSASGLTPALKQVRGWPVVGGGTSIGQYCLQQSEKTS